MTFLEINAHHFEKNVKKTLAFWKNFKISVFFIHFFKKSKILYAKHKLPVLHRKTPSLKISTTRQLLEPKITREMGLQRQKKF